MILYFFGSSFSKQALYKPILVCPGSCHALMHHERDFVMHHLKILVGKLPDVFGLFEFISPNCLSISLIETSLNEKWSPFSIFWLIGRMLGWFLCVHSLIYRISNTRTRICDIRIFVNIYSFYCISEKIVRFLWYKLSSGMIFSLLFSRIILFSNFLFSVEKVRYFSKKLYYR